MRLWLAMGLLMICGIARAEPVTLREGGPARVPAPGAAEAVAALPSGASEVPDGQAAPGASPPDDPSGEAASLTAPRGEDAAPARPAPRTPPQAAVPVTPGTLLPALRNVVPASPVETPASTAVVVPVDKALDLQERARATPEAQSARTRVFATTDGRFHRRDCRFAREALPLSRGEAVAKKLRPCTACRP